MFDGKDYLIHDSGPESASGRMLISCRGRKVRELCGADVSLRTFRSASPPLQQIFVIFALKDGWVIPSVFVMLTKQIEARAHAHLEVCLRHCRSPLNTRGKSGLRVCCHDYAARGARGRHLLWMFLYLFTRLDRHVASEGLRERYLEDRDFRYAVRMLTASAFLPQHKAEATFDELVDVALPKADPCIVNFLAYFRNAWIASMPLGRGGGRLKRAPTIPNAILSVCWRHQLAATRNNNVAENSHMQYSTYVADGTKLSYKQLCGLHRPPGGPDETCPRRVSLWPCACATSRLGQAERRARAADGPLTRSTTLAIQPLCRRWPGRTRRQRLAEWIGMTHGWSG